MLPLLTLVLVAVMVQGGSALHNNDNGIGSLLKPPMGWMTWEHIGCNRDCTTYPDTCVSENLIKRVADQLVTQGYRDKGYVYVNIDDCYLAPRDPVTGKLQADPKRFPSGMAALSDYVHERGLKLGIYNDIGTSTCAGDPGLAVSPTNDPVADKQLAMDMQTFAEWQVDSIKVGWCTALSTVLWL